MNFGALKEQSLHLQGDLSLNPNPSECFSHYNSTDLRLKLNIVNLGASFNFSLTSINFLMIKATNSYYKCAVGAAMTWFHVGFVFWGGSNLDGQSLFNF